MVIQGIENHDVGKHLGSMNFCCQAPSTALGDTHFGAAVHVSPGTPAPMGITIGIVQG